MARYNRQNLKMMYVLQILLEHSDEENILPMGGILEHLMNYGITAERKSIYSDIESLRELGYDIICQKGRNPGYFIGERDFELAELKLLVDSVQSSKFITKKKTNLLIKKLEGLTSKYYGRQLHRQVYISDRIKATNETVYYNVDRLHNAITDGVKVAFKYYEYNLDKTKKLRNNGGDYTVSPYNLTFSDDNYYLISHYPKNERLTHFRVDRMIDIRYLSEKSVNINDIMGESFILGDYLKKTFDMYGGHTERISILCENKLINHIIDKFGEDVRVRKHDEKHFTATFYANISPTFYAWIFTFGKEIKIISPKNVSNEFIKTAKEIIKEY